MIPLSFVPVSVQFLHASGPHVRDEATLPVADICNVDPRVPCGGGGPVVGLLARVMLSIWLHIVGYYRAGSSLVGAKVYHQRGPLLGLGRNVSLYELHKVLLGDAQDVLCVFFGYRVGKKAC